MKIYPTPFKRNLQCGLMLAAALLLNPIAYAEADKPAEDQSASSAPPEKLENNILSIISGDWNKDKRSDVAVLLKSEDQADLYIYSGNSKGFLELSLTKKNIVWSGALAGTLPHFNVDKSGNLLIYAENSAIGRNRWYQRLNIGYRDNDFLVTGYGYEEYDTLDPKAGFSCDVNLLSGDAFKGKNRFKIDGQKIKVLDWNEEKIPKECRGQ